MKRSPVKRHLDALARSGSETSLMRPAQRGLSHTHSASATDLHRDHESLDVPSRIGGGLQRTPSRGSLAKNLKQLPPLETPSVHKNTRNQSDQRIGREKKDAAKKDVGGVKNRTGYSEAFERPAINHGDNLDLPIKERFEQEAKALRESALAAASKTQLANAFEQECQGEATAARAESEHSAIGQETQDASSSSSQCYFKPDPLGCFRDQKVPEKPAGPPPLSEAEKDLMGAVCSGDLKKAEELLSEHGPSLLSGQGAGGITTTAILYAAQGGNKEMCDLLVTMGGPQVLEKGRDIKSRGPAEYAQKGGHEELAAHLKTLESNANAGNKQETKKMESIWRP